MNINNISKIIVTATRDELNDYLLNPPYWDRHSLSPSTPDVDDILEDIFCARAIKKIISQEYPQSDFNGQIDRRYFYSATRSGPNNWRWTVSTRIITGENSRSSWESGSGEFSVDFVVIGDKESSGVSIQYNEQEVC